MQFPETLLIIPCYNEHGRLPLDALVEAVETRPWLSLLMVNDGSADATLETLHELERRAPGRIEVFSLDQNQGKGAAIRAGLLSITRQEIEVVGYFDADLATPLDAVEDLLTMRENLGVGVVIGSRVQLMGRRITRNPLRHYMGRIFATLASLILEESIYDTQCGAKIFSQGPMLDAVFAQPFTVNWAFDIQILARIKRYSQIHDLGPLEAHVAEFPLWRWADIPGSKVRLRHTFHIGRDLFHLWMNRRRDQRTGAIMGEGGKSYS